MVHLELEFPDDVDVTGMGGFYEEGVRKGIEGTIRWLLVNGLPQEGPDGPSLEDLKLSVLGLMEDHEPGVSGAALKVACEHGIWAYRNGWGSYVRRVSDTDLHLGGDGG